MIFYKTIYEFDIVLMNESMRNYRTEKEAWEVFYEFYKDPDEYAINEKGFRRRNDIKCTVDGLLSVNRIHQHEQGFNKNFVEAFTTYRKIPIIFFPSEMNGINFSRAKTFGDRIDHTLYDLKQYCEKNSGKLKTSYELPKTQSWLQSFNKSFSDIVKWMNIDGIFVDNNNNIYDLEKGNGEIICDYCEKYERSWSSNYYKNVKEKIDTYKKKFYPEASD